MSDVSDASDAEPDQQGEEPPPDRWELNRRGVVCDHHYEREYFTDSVKLRAFRETKEQARVAMYVNGERVYHVIFPDGVRKQMRAIKGNGATRGYYCNHDKYHYFGFYIPKKGSTDAADGQQPGEPGLVTNMLQDGQRFYRAEVFIKSRMDNGWVYQQLVGVEAIESQMPIATVYEFRRF